MCYAAPLASALITSLLLKHHPNKKLWWLNLMFYGAALFGVIDHLWNGQLLIVPQNLISDLLLGLVISLTVLALWFVITKLPSTKQYLLPSNKEHEFRI